MKAETRVESLLAEWVLGQLAPEDVPALAIAALQDGCESSAAAVLAGLHRPTRAEIEAELPQLLHELGMQRPGREEALKVLVDETTDAIVAESISPVTGAELIRALWRSGFDAARDPEMWLDIGPLVEFRLSADAPDGAGTASAAAISQRARALLARGGLNIGSTITAGQLDERELSQCQVQEHVLGGVRTTLRLALGFADGLYVTFGAAAGATRLELGFRPARPFDLGEDGRVELRTGGFPCDVLSSGKVIQTVTPLLDASGQTRAVQIKAGESSVYVHLQGENVAITAELPDAVSFPSLTVRRLDE